MSPAKYLAGMLARCKTKNRIPVRRCDRGIQARVRAKNSDPIHAILADDVRADTPQPFVNAHERRPASSPDSPRQEASGGIRTLNHRFTKLDGERPNGKQYQGDTDAASRVVPKLVPRKPENGPKPTESDTNRLTVITELLADLPAAEQGKVIAELTPADRVASAQLLIGRDREGDGQ